MPIKNIEISKCRKIDITIKKWIYFVNIFTLIAVMVPLNGFVCGSYHVENNKRLKNVMLCQLYYSKYLNWKIKTGNFETIKQGKVPTRAIVIVEIKNEKTNNRILPTLKVRKAWVSNFDISPSWTIIIILLS